MRPGCPSVLSTLALVVLPALAWSTAAWSADDPSGAPAGYRVVRADRPAAPAGLNDMLRTPAEATTPQAAPKANTDLVQLPSLTQRGIELWERLSALSPAQRANAEIELEFGSKAGPADRLAASRVRELWDGGLYDEAIAELRSFESGGGRAALGIAWKEPLTPTGGLSTAGGGTDVRIGTRTDGRLVSLEHDAASGGLYAVVGWGATTGGEAYWTVNRSTNDGASWAETYSWYAGATGGLVDVSATVVGGFVYIGYVEGDVASEYRLRRCSAATGAVDAGYGYKVVVNAGTLSIREVTVVSNAMSSDNRLYCFAIQSDNAVRHFWTVASTATSFSELSPAGASARTGLDASWNPGYATNYLHLAYAGTDDKIHVQCLSPSGWTDVTLLSAAAVSHRHGVSVSSYQDVLICAYELQMTNGQGIAYGISYAGGAGSWDLYNYVFEPAAGEGPYQCPDVDTHNGVGCAIIASHEEGEPDAVYCRKRAVFAPGLWEDKWPFNDHDVTTGTPTTLAPVPVLGPTCFGLGAIYFYGASPYFDLPMLGTADVPGPGAATGVRLHPPAPNPFTDRATVRFTLPAAGPARLEVFDVFGARVATLADGPMEAGTHAFQVDGRGLGSGVYFCRLTAGPARQVERFLVIH
jgi:hypothetical protein